MNITLSADEKTIERSRNYAARHNTTLNSLIRYYMKSLAGKNNRSTKAEEFIELARKHAGQSHEGFRFNREEAHNRGSR
jgi:Family of unknown function (DUF6364)